MPRRVGLVYHQERFVEVVDIDHVDVDGPQRERRVTVVRPLVGDARAGKRAPVIGAILEIDRQLDLGLGLVDRTEPPRAPGHQETRESQPGRYAELRSPLLLGIGSLHKLITGRERNVECFGTPENIAVLVAHGGFQPVEARRGASFQIDLEALFQGRGTEDIAFQVPFPRIAGLRGIGRCSDKGDIVGDIGTLGLLLEFDFGALEIPERHQVGIRAVHLCRIVDIVRVERHRLPQDRGSQVGAFLADDIQAAVIERVEPLQEGRIGSGYRRVVIGEDVDLVDTVDHVVVHDRKAALVISRKVLLDNQFEPDLMAAAQRIGHILDVVDRKVVIPPLLEVGRNTLALAVEYRDVEDAALAEQRIGGIGKDDLFEELVPELIGNGVDPVRLALPGSVGDPGAFAPRSGIHLEGHLRRAKSLRIHKDLQVLGTPLRQAHVQQYGLLPDPALPVVPPVLLAGIGLLVEPDIEIGTQKTFVRGLAHVFLEISRSDTLLAGRRLVGVDLHLLQQVLTFGDLARDAACGADQAQHGGNEYTTGPPHPSVSC